MNSSALGLAGACATDVADAWDVAALVAELEVTYQAPWRGTPDAVASCAICGGECSSAAGA